MSRIRKRCYVCIHLKRITGFFECKAKNEIICRHHELSDRRGATCNKFKRNYRELYVNEDSFCCSHCGKTLDPNGTYPWIMNDEEPLSFCNIECLKKHND